MISSLKRCGFSVLFCLASLFFFVSSLNMAFGLSYLEGPQEQVIGIYLMPRWKRYGMHYKEMVSSMS